MNGEKDLTLPIEYQNSKKPILKLLRNHFQKTENEEIKGEFENFTNLDKIENNIFSNQGEYLPIRIFIKHNVNQQKKKSSNNKK